MSREFDVILSGIFVGFYNLVFYFIGMKFVNHKKFIHCLFVILGSVVVLFSYGFYFNYFIKNELTHRIIMKNFVGLSVGSVGFCHYTKKK